MVSHNAMESGETENLFDSSKNFSRFQLFRAEGESSMAFESFKDSLSFAVVFARSLVHDR